jgi:CRISPR-associated endonuclease Csn1
MADSKPGITVIDESIDPRFRRMKSFKSNKQLILNGELGALNGYRTTGEYLASLNTNEVRQRNRFLLREHLEVELDLILGIQAKYHDLLTDEVIDEIKNLVFSQRPLKSARALVGNCRFEIGKKRAHKSHPEYQRFRMLQQVNAFKVFGPGRVLDDDRILKPDERAALINALSNGNSIDTTAKKGTNISKIIGLPGKAEYTFSVDRLDACSTVRKLTAILGTDAVISMSREILHSIWNVLNMAEHTEWLERHAVEKWGFTPAQAVQISKVKLEEGYASLSLKAIRKILPFLEEGLMYHEACAEAGYQHSRPDGPVQLSNVVPALSNSDIRNPIVTTSYAEMRKVVNLLIKKYGSFDEVHVELARELKKPKSERLQIQKRQKGFRDENEIIRSKLRLEFRIDRPTKSDVERYKLWEEQNHRCMYTGKPISQDLLFSGPVDVDHILPYSRTLDDSRMNKVLCLKDVNIAKGDLTPREACDAGIISYHELRERVEALVRVYKIAKAKSARLFMTTEEMQKLYGENFVERQLNDTRYVGRLTLSKLGYVCKNVVVANGLLTSSLRRRWGLNSVIPDLAKEGRAWIDDEAHSNGVKSRADHRHHAVDALVVALTSRSLLQRVATLNARSAGTKIEQHFADGRIRLPDEPIPGLVAIAKRMVDKIVVSHKVNRKSRGQLHEETLYGVAHDSFGVPLTNEDGMPLYVIRKSLHSISSGEAKDIVDPIVRKIVLDRIASYGVDVNGKFTIPNNAFELPLYMKRKDGSRGPRIRSVRIFKASSGMVKLRKNGVFVEPGSNDHIRLFQKAEGEKKRRAEVLTLLEKVGGMRPSRESPEVTYRINEVYCATTNADGIDDQVNLYRVQLMSKADSRLVFRQIAAATINNKSARLIKVPSSVDGFKIVVTEIGEVLTKC